MTSSSSGSSAGSSLGNRSIILAERPRYIVPTANCFKLVTRPMPTIGPGQILIRTLSVSMDVMLYSRVQRISGDAEPIAIDDVMVGPAVGRVEQSQHPDYQPGELLSGFWGWQDYAVSDGLRIRKLDFGVQKPSYGVSVYGVSGFAAWLALEVLAPPKAGETVVVGTALGGLGHIAGQIAKLKGCRVVGIAGGPEKCRIAVEKLGFDACVDHKAKNFVEALRAACPRGIDVDVETIGGKVLDGIFPLLNLNARIAACGLMATPRLGESDLKGRYQHSMNVMYATINRRLSIRGLVVFDHLRARLPDFQREMKGWIDSGQVKPMEDIIDGLEHAPVAFNGIFEGRNRGKCVVRVAD